MARFARPLSALVAILSSLALFACGGNDAASSGSGTSAPKPTKVTFMAGYKAQSNLPFVGAYVAQKKGFFAEENLQVEILHDTTGGQHLQLLTSGEIQFATADAANVIERIADPGLPIVSIALIGQTGQQGWVALKDSGIKSPADWKGKNVAYRTTIPPDLPAILHDNGLTMNDIKAIDIGYQPPQLLSEGKVDVYPCFLSNEPDTVRRVIGKDVNVFTAAENGAPTLGLTYIAASDFVDKNPETVQRFLKATLKGIEYARDHRDETIDIVLEYAPQADRAHERFMLDTELAAAESAVTAANGLGWQTLDQWTKLTDWLKQYSGLQKTEAPSKAFSDAALKAIYKDGKLIWP